MRSQKGSMTGPSEYVQATWLISRNNDLASVCPWDQKVWYHLLSGLRKGHPRGRYLEAPKLHNILAELEFVTVVYDSIFCSMKQKIEGVIEGSYGRVSVFTQPLHMDRMWHKVIFKWS